MTGLAALFFITAGVYACVGFGGGSTYNALLILNSTPYQMVPVIALCCNIIVVSGGTYHFFRAGHIKICKTLPWVIFSVPAALIGGWLSISETSFIGMLGLALLLSSIRMFWSDTKLNLSIRYKQQFRPYTSSFIGAGLGFVAGVTGIGGGIFLAPVLHLLRWDHPKAIAGICSLFILVNSLAGLTGQFLKNPDMLNNTNILSYWPLLLAVLIGGQIGSILSVTYINAKIIKQLTALLILYVALRLLYRWAIIFF